MLGNDTNEEIQVQCTLDTIGRLYRLPPISIYAKDYDKGSWDDIKTMVNEKMSYELDEVITNCIKDEDIILPSYIDLRTPDMMIVEVSSAKIITSP